MGWVGRADTTLAGHARDLPGHRRGRRDPRWDPVRGGRGRREGRAAL